MSLTALHTVLQLFLITFWIQNSYQDISMDKGLDPSWPCPVPASDLGLLHISLLLTRAPVAWISVCFLDTPQMALFIQGPLQDLCPGCVLNPTWDVLPTEPCVSFSHSQVSAQLWCPPHWMQPPTPSSPCPVLLPSEHRSLLGIIRYHPFGSLCLPPLKNVTIAPNIYLVQQLVYVEGTLIITLIRHVPRRRWSGEHAASS